MNAAFLLVTSAWLAGADPAPPAKPIPAPVASPAPALAPAPAYASGSCSSGGCDTCGDACSSGCGKHSFFSRLKGHGHKKGCGCEEVSSCSTCAAPAPVATTSCCSSCDTCGDPCARKHGGFLKGLFAKHGHKGCGCETAACDSCGATTSAPAAWPAAPAPLAPGKPAGEPLPAPKDLPSKKMPSGASLNGAPSLDITPAASKITETETNKNPFDLDRRYQARADRAADYSRLTGQLFYVHADGGIWVLRYAPIGKEEANGGSVVLARDLRMDSYREGDLVTVRGEVLQDKAPARLGGALYHAQSIELIDRARP